MLKKRIGKRVINEENEMNFRKTFQIISYLQYPIAIISIYFFVQEDYNNFLIFFGLAISLSTLQDTNKTQTKFDRIIMESPKKGKFLLVIISIMTFATIIYGLFGYVISDNEKIQGLSVGLIVLGIGLISFLKTGAEMFENHRKDKNTPTNKV